MRINFTRNQQQALAGLVEIPAIAITMLIIMKVGKKKWLFCSAIFCAGIACACTLINDTSSSQWIKITMLMLGKLINYFASTS